MTSGKVPLWFTAATLCARISFKRTVGNEVFTTHVFDIVGLAVLWKMPTEFLPTT